MTADKRLQKLEERVETLSRTVERLEAEGKERAKANEKRATAHERPVADLGERFRNIAVFAEQHKARAAQMQEILHSLDRLVEINKRRLEELGLA